MCVTCGCGQGETRIEGEPAQAASEADAGMHTHADGTLHRHSHEPEHVHGHAGAHWHRHADGSWHDHAHGDAYAHGHEHGHEHERAGATLGAVHAAGIEPARMVQIERDILAKNDAVAAANRQLLADRGIFAINLVSSPGSGKTTLLVKTIEALRGRVAASVIEGDQQTSRDAERIRATGAPAIQVNTGKGCHLDADMVGRALASLDPTDGSLLLIENVGNLVCPAAFDLGEAHKVAILSVTEGDDKPIKYPDMFHAADLLLINKIDLLPYVDFDVEAAIAFARRVKPDIEVMRVSAKTGEGFDAWLAWLERGTTTAKGRRDASVAALRRRLGELEAERASA